MKPPLSFRTLTSRNFGTSTLVIALTASALLSQGVQAAPIIKANNTDALNLTTSWTGGVVPGLNDIATWDSTVTSANSVLLGSNLSIAGIKVTNPGGPVTIGTGSTLTIGRNGVDLSTATQSLSLGTVATLGYTAQTWNAGNQALNVTTLTRGGGSTINFVTSGGGVINIASGTASAQIGVYATLNSSDYAALDASKNVIAATYTDYAAGGSISGTYAGILNVTGTSTGATQAWRQSNALTVSSGVRFGQNNTQNTKWTVDTSSSGRLLTSPSILVGVNVTQDVEFNGSGGIRPTASGGDLLLQNYGTGNLIFNTTINNGNPTATNVVVSGGGKVTINSASGYTGATQIVNGTFALGATGSVGSTQITTAVSGVFDVSAVTGGYALTTGKTLTNNGIVNGVLTVNSGATLNGSGTFNALTTVNGALNPGNSPGLQTYTSGLTLGSGSTTTMEIAGVGVAGIAYDSVNVSGGTLTLGGTLNIVAFGGYDPSATASYNLFDGTTTGDFVAVNAFGIGLTNTAGVWTGTSGVGSTYTFTQSDGILNVVAAAVPEPSALLLSGIGALALLRRRRAA